MPRDSGSDNYYSCPFGKYQGDVICQVPSGYLKWIISNLDGSTHDAVEFVMEAEDELEYRDDAQTHFYN
jgi:hypothetical protein